MRHIDVTKLRADLSRSLDSVTTETIIVEKNGKPFVAIVPASQVLQSKKPDFDRAWLAPFCKKHRIQKFSLFGSVLTDEFGPESDIDILIDVPNDEHLKLNCMNMELQDRLGRRVDLITRAALSASRNWIRKGHILSTAREIYAT